jgi:hypothetical protein
MTRMATTRGVSWAAEVVGDGVCDILIPVFDVLMIALSFDHTGRHGKIQHKFTYRRGFKPVIND